MSRRTGAPRAAARPLDPLVHARARLGILGELARTPGLSFADLRRRLELSDGNLGAHAHKLARAGYVVASRSFEGRTPRTEYRLTPTGKRALERYLAAMATVIRAARR